VSKANKINKMKRIIILGDGMADEPIAALGGKTPLQAAHKPTIDKLAQLGKNGVFSTVPDGFKPGSEIANMTVLGYNVRTEFEGRGSLEAASIGVAIQPGEMAMRCNIICVENGNIKNSVNFPDCEMPKAGTRITIAHKNIPSMLANLSKIVSDQGINIENMMNKSKKENAYTIMDIEGVAEDGVINAILAVEGVYSARLIK
jgi:2,3-diphosphopglycerate-independent phosphoglycerate mutase